MPIEAIDLARHIVDLIADKKGEDIILIDIHEQTVIADYFVICSGDNERQIKAIVESLQTEMKKRHGVYALAVEGEAPNGWVLVDFGAVIVHVFAPVARAYYDLESVWRESPVLLKMQ